jgi:hypothetical protein
MRVRRCEHTSLKVSKKDLHLLKAILSCATEKKERGSLLGTILQNGGTESRVCNYQRASTLRMSYSLYNH